MKIIFATSTKKDGSMGLMREFHSREAVLNRKRFFRKLGIAPGGAIRAEQVHGPNVAIVRATPTGDVIPKADALVTDTPFFLYLLSADCFPVFFYHRTIPAVGIAHAGWRGITKGVVPNTIRALKKFKGVEAKDVYAVIGPGIGACHFEIQEDVLPAFKKFPTYILRRKRRTFVDLAGIIQSQLQGSGVPARNVTKKGGCTYHAPNMYFSYRRDKSGERPKGIGNMISVIGTKF